MADFLLSHAFQAYVGYLWGAAGIFWALLAYGQYRGEIPPIREMDCLPYLVAVISLLVCGFIWWSM